MKLTIEFSDKVFEDFKQLSKCLPSEMSEFHLHTEKDFFQNAETRIAEKQKRDQENRKHREEMKKSRETA